MRKLLNRLSDWSKTFLGSLICGVIISALLMSVGFVVLWHVIAMYGGN